MFKGYKGARKREEMEDSGKQWYSGKGIALSEVGEDGI